MSITIPEQAITGFLGGLAAILALLAVGVMVAFLLRGTMKGLPFIRISLVLALAPLSLFRLLDRSASIALLAYAAAVILLGILIDGLHYLRTSNNPLDAKPTETPADDADSNSIVWEKAE